MMTFLLGVLAILCWIFHIWRRSYKYWKTRGFPYLEGRFPFGNLRELVLLQGFQGTAVQRAYRELAPHPYGGVFACRSPLLLIRDPEVVKNVLAKDFSFFRDRAPVAFSTKEPIRNHLFNLGGSQWKALRTKLAPTFSSAKVKGMFPIMVQCAEKLESLLKDEGESFIVDIKDTMARFTMDVIGTCAFGLDIGSLQNSGSPFRALGLQVFPQCVPFSLRFQKLLTAFIPIIGNLMSLRVVPKCVNNFIMSMVSDTVQFREQSGSRRHDFLDLLIDLKNEKRVDMGIKEVCELGPQNDDFANFEMTADALAAQCYMFFIAGFETSSSVQSYCLYELALNPDIQGKLRDEIQTTIKAHNGLTYQAVQEMTFLEQVVWETMRKYPTVPVLTRQCSKTYRMPDTGLLVEEGTKLIIPVYALHHDTKYFPDPEKFDPDRFSPERKKEIRPFTFLPFGEGPRLCIGMRFGLIQTKMGIATVLNKYEISTTTRTKIPLRFVASIVVSTVGHPLILRLSVKESGKTSKEKSIHP